MNDLSSKVQRLIVLPKGSPPEAVEALWTGFDAVAHDKDFIADYRRITGEEPDLVTADLIEPLFERMRHVDPEITRVLKESVGAD